MKSFEFLLINYLPFFPWPPIPSSLLTFLSLTSLTLRDLQLSGFTCCHKWGVASTMDENHEISLYWYLRLYTLLVILNLELHLRGIKY